MGYYYAALDQGYTLFQNWCWEEGREGKLLGDKLKDLRHQNLLTKDEKANQSQKSHRRVMFTTQHYLVLLKYVISEHSFPKCVGFLVRNCVDLDKGSHIHVWYFLLVDRGFLASPCQTCRSCTALLLLNSPLPWQQQQQMLK